MFRTSILATVTILIMGCQGQPSPENGQTSAPTPQVSSASPAPTPPSPACNSEAHRAFDFWIGEWEVFGPNDQKAGDNSITREEGGCLLQERWTAISGRTGQSYNFLDPASGKWRQVWVSAGAVIDYSGGLTESGSMRLEGKITYQGGGGTFDFFGEWTPNADGTVTQHFEQYDPESESWKPWFTGTYKRKSK